MSVDDVVSKIILWLKRVVSIGLLLVLASTVVSMFGFRTPLPNLSLDQGTGIALAGIAFLLWKI